MHYGALLTFDADPDRSQYLDETPASMTLSLDRTETRCTACGHFVRWLHGKWWADEDGGSGSQCDPAHGGGAHQPERLPFSWMADATIQLQPQGDSGSEAVEVSITLPNGTVKLRIERMIDPDGSAESARLLVRVTQPGDPGAPPLTASGTSYVVG